MQSPAGDASEEGYNPRIIDGFSTLQCVIAAPNLDPAFVSGDTALIRVPP